jgi:uncharacterized membrane protein YjjB (DUF3815 family)
VLLVNILLQRLARRALIVLLGKYPRVLLTCVLVATLANMVLLLAVQLVPVVLLDNIHP